MDDAIGWMPDAPHAHLMLTVRTAQGVPTRTLLVALAVGHRCDNLNRSLDDTLDLRQGLLNETLQPGKRLGRLHPVIADTLEAFGHRMLHHAADKCVHSDGFALHPVGTVSG